MIFEWPDMLWALLIVPVLVGLYIGIARRKKRAVSLYAAWLSPTAAPRLKRHLPPALFLAAIVGLIAASARPVAVLPLPTMHGTVILAVDISNSMQADDLEPTRLAAAQKAAREFIEAQPSTTQIGIVAFAETALPVQRPTENREDLLKAVDRLKPQEGTAVGGAILAGLQTLFPKEVFEIKSADEQKTEAAPLDVGPKPAPTTTTERDPGSETSAAMILLTDGQTTGGPNPVEAAKLAAQRGVRVFTVGIGTEPGAVVKLKGMSMRVQLDEKTLKDIADITRARYFLAGNAQDLRDIYRDLNTRLKTETRETEISSLFVAVAAALALLASALSMTWFNRIL